MEIVGVGTDIVECVRIARMIEEHGELFLTQVYTESEILHARGRKRTTEHFSALWAAKEAILHSLNIGWRRGIAWTDIEIRWDNQGIPRVQLRGALRDLGERLGVGTIHVALSHCRSYATAYATAVRDKVPPGEKV